MGFISDYGFLYLPIMHVYNAKCLSWSKDSQRSKTPQWWFISCVYGPLGERERSESIHSYGRNERDHR